MHNVSELLLDLLSPLLLLARADSELKLHPHTLTDRFSLFSTHDITHGSYFCLP
jgi:hypothetical protein